MKPLDLVFVSVGGNGTVLPLITIGTGLVQRGHRVDLIAHHIYRNMAEAGNISFQAISDEEAYWKGVINKPLTFGRYRDLFSARCAVGWNSRIFDILRRYPPHSVLLSVDRANLWADFALRSISDVPLIRLQFDLPGVKGSIAGEGLPATRTQEVLRHRAALAWQGEYEALGGRAGRSQLFRIHRSVRSHRVALWPRWITGKYPHSSPVDCHVGFIPPPPDAPTDELIGWINSCSAPLIVFISGTLGTTRHWHSQFLTESLHVCEKTGCAGLLLGSEDVVGECRLPAWFRWERFAPIDQILSHASVIVHHGGIGTAAAAIRRSVPQIIIPRVFAQFSNAEWMKRANLAVVLSSREYRQQTLLAAFEQHAGQRSSLEYHSRVINRTSFDQQLQTLEEYVNGAVCGQRVDSP